MVSSPASETPFLLCPLVFFFSKYEMTI
jgi:hypothetical protein